MHEQVREKTAEAKRQFGSRRAPQKRRPDPQVCVEIPYCEVAKQLLATALSQPIEEPLPVTMASRDRAGSQATAVSQPTGAPLYDLPVKYLLWSCWLDGGRPLSLGNAQEDMDWCRTFAAPGVNRPGRTSMKATEAP